MDRIPGNQVDPTRPSDADEAPDSDEQDVSVAEAAAPDERDETAIEEEPQATMTSTVDDLAAAEETASDARVDETPAEEAVAEPAQEQPVVDEAPEPPATEEDESSEGSVADEEGVSLLDDWQPGEWFVVHTYAGYENKVKANLLTRIQSMNMEDLIYEVVIPMEDVVEMKGGKKQVVQRKVFPGYLLVRMDLDDDSWYVVRNTPGVTGFVGSASKPIPLSESEVDNILKRGEAAEEERPRPRAEWQVNDPVRVTTGPFANFQGVVSEIDLDRSKLKVLVNIFGRETPVELGFDQVSKV